MMASLIACWGVIDGKDRVGVAVSDDGKVGRKDEAFDAPAVNDNAACLKDGFRHP